MYATGLLHTTQCQSDIIHKLLVISTTPINQDAPLSFHLREADKGYKETTKLERERLEIWKRNLTAGHPTKESNIRLSA